MPVHGGLGRGRQIGGAHVADDSYDDAPERVAPVLHRHALPQSRLSRPRRAREGLAHHHHARRAGTIARPERAAVAERDAQRLEIAGVRDPDPGVHVDAGPRVDADARGGASGERQPVYEARRSHAWNGPDGLEHRGEQRRLPRRIVAVPVAERQIDADHAPPAKSGIHLLQLQE